MKRSAILTRLYFRAVFPAIADVSRWQPDTFAGQPCSISFRTPSGEAVCLQVDADGRATHTTTFEAAQLQLCFFSEAHAAAVLQKRTKLPPLPVRGLSHLGNAKAFEAITQQLENQLQPDSAALDTEDARMRFCQLSLAVGTRAVTVLADCHEPTQLSCQNGLKGITSFQLGEHGEPIWLELADNRVTSGIGDLPRPADAKVVFRDATVATAALNQKLDAMAAVADGRIRVSGLVPLADHANHLLEAAGKWLKP